MVVYQSQNDIYLPVERDLQRVVTNLSAVWESQEDQHSGVAERLAHVLATPGKRVRPAVTLLVSRLWGREPDERTIKMATAVELLHIATLIHDDTIDMADTRRGFATASNLWGGSMAVLLGDYVFAYSAMFVCDTHSVRLIRRFAETISELARGELNEMLDAWNPATTRASYFSRIYDKTASLFSTAAESGAVLGEGDEESVESLRSYGRNLGLAYQIVDDVLDYRSTSKVLGKPASHDLSEGVLTLPALIALQNGWAPALREYVTSDESDREELLHEAYRQICSSEALTVANDTAEEYLDQAAAAIGPLPDSEAKAALLGLVQFARTRAN